MHILLPAVDIAAWIKTHESLFWWLTISSALAFIGTLIVVPLLLIRMPADYFTRQQPYYHGRHPIIRWTIIISKNLFGIIFLLAGIAMLFLPGQGILTILLAITLLNFPGKRYLERQFISLPRVFSTINHIRGQANQPPLISPHQEKIIKEIIPHNGDDK
jgi:archaellum biogenesis protein FlaJ (TadC family)